MITSGCNLITCHRSHITLEAEAQFAATGILTEADMEGSSIRHYIQLGWKGERVIKLTVWVTRDGVGTREVTMYFSIPMAHVVLHLMFLGRRTHGYMIAEGIGFWLDLMRHMPNNNSDSKG